MTPLVIFHANCADGFCAAWIASKNLPDAEFLPMHYGVPAPDVTGRDCYILDFSFPRAEMIRLSQTARKLVCLDHHKTAAAELAGLSAGSDTGLIRFDTGKSGGRMTWEYFHQTAPAPWLVDYTEDRDLWLWKLPHSKAVNAGLASFERTFEQWDKLSNWSTWNIGDEGYSIIRYQNQLVNLAAAAAVEIDLAGYKVLSVNTTVLMSEIGERLAVGRPFSATYYVRADGKRVWSLRSSEEGVDVSEIARKFGGGGHVRSAGFEQ